MKIRYFFASITILLVMLSSTLLAQETEERVIDEVVAVVNENVITLSQVKREKQNLVDTLVLQGKSEEEAKTKANTAEGELIAGLIIQEMMWQKGVEVGLDKSVESEVNQRLVTLMKENKLRTLTELYNEMKRQGVEPEQLKKQWRMELMKQQVMMNFVDRVVYWDTPDKEIKEYFAANKEKFVQKASVSLSEIFLPFAGKNEEDVIALAKALSLRAKNGEEFAKLAVEYSQRPNVAETNGFVGEFEVEALNDDIKNAIKGLDTGDLAEPIKWETGMEIIRVDKFVPASTESNFDEGKVRSAILAEKAPKARQEYIKKLQEDAYVKIRESYRGAVSPFLADYDITKSIAAVQ
ncbi:MAG: peptidylprolyl isomerase [Pyrinomonadaceae bacterium]